MIIIKFINSKKLIKPFYTIIKYIIDILYNINPKLKKFKFVLHVKITILFFISLNATMDPLLNEKLFSDYKNSVVYEFSSELSEIPAN